MSRYGDMGLLLGSSLTHSILSNMRRADEAA